jgi:5-methylcytosine-specific restriction protein A
MNAGSGEQISALIMQKLGLRFTTEVSGGEMIISPSDHHPNESFSIRFAPGWRSADAYLSPGTFAGTMVRSMGQAGANEKLLFGGYVSALKQAGLQVAMTVNGSAVDAENPSGWTDQWNAFSISLRKTALVFDLNNDAELLPVADLLVTPLAAMAVALIGTENVEAIEGEVEGAAVQYLATRYERSRLNRDACIRLHGTDCAGCGFSFGTFYGVKAEGFIEVHHIESLATGGEVRINPATDLIPLCSNCHSFVHRFTPPLPVAELRRIIAERRTPCCDA